jgi:hypothetical protein
MRLGTLTKLIEKTGSKASALKLLNSAGIPCVHDFYDQDRLDAHLAVPPGMLAKRLEWGIAPTQGIGAIKSCMDAANLRITAHYLRGANYFDVIKGGENRHLKMYYTNKAHSEQTTAVFTFTNFLINEELKYYGACAISIPAMWVISRVALIKCWDRLQKNKSKLGYQLKEKGTHMWLPYKSQKHPGGQLKIMFSIKDTRYALPLPDGAK